MRRSRVQLPPRAPANKRKRWDPGPLSDRPSRAHPAGRSTTRREPPCWTAVAAAPTRGQQRGSRPPASPPVGRGRGPLHRPRSAPASTSDLPESRLIHDAATGRLTLAGGDVGVSRRLAKADTVVEAVVHLVAKNPGLSK